MPAMLGGTLADQAAPVAVPGAERTLWADAAKGVCILLVVAWHIIMKHFLQIDWKLSAPLPGVWGAFGDLLLPLRMPLFFAISGMFAVSAVNRPWRVVARSRVAKFLYLYVLWLMIHTAVLESLPVPFDTLHATNGWQLLEQLTVTPTNLWYLYALAIYFVIAKVLRTLPMAPVLVLAFALSAISAAGWLDVPGNRAGLYQNLFFFLCGLYFRPVIESLAARTSWPRVGAATLAYAAVLGAVTVLGLAKVPGIWPAMSILATVFGIVAIAKVAQWRPLGERLAYLGRQTLPIYVIHLPLVAVAQWLLVDALSSAPPGAQYVVAVLEPVVLTAVIVAVCLLLHRALLALHAYWLFDLPHRREPKD
jgi:uncharacterized membrane protein YcfT